MFEFLNTLGGKDRQIKDAKIATLEKEVKKLKKKLHKPPLVQDPQLTTPEIEKELKRQNQLLAEVKRIAVSRSTPNRDKIIARHRRERDKELGKTPTENDGRITD